MKQIAEDPTKLLRRLAAGIDGVLDAEMSSALDNLLESGSAPSGDLADRDLPSLLGRAFVEGLTGRMRVSDGSVEKAIYFEAGLPVMASSTDAADRMLAMLVRESVIDARQYEETARVVDATGRKVGAVLVDLGFLRSDELLPAVRRHYESIVLSLFAWHSGRWQIDWGLTAGPDRTRLLRHPAALVRDGLDRGYPVQKIVSALGSEQAVFMMDTSPTSADVAAQALEDRVEARVPMLFDGVRSMHSIAQATAVTEASVHKIALTLSCFGVLRAVDTEKSSHAATPSGLRDLTIVRDRVHARYALALESDYFRMLGVDRTADAAGIRRAHGHLRHELAPESLGPEIWHELREQVETICDVLDEGLRVLTSPILRSAYQFNVTHGPDADRAAATPLPTALVRR